MSVAFNNTKGKAQSKKVESYTYKDGENIVRLIGGVLPRYMYWVRGTNGKDIPVECLSFDREAEKFTNAEVDHVPKYFPELKCSWAYSINCIDPSDGKVKVLNLKKKLFEQILTAAEDLGNPTDYDEGWDVTWKRVKTGPLPFNVEHSLQVLRCKKRPLTEAERKVAEEAEKEPNDIDSKYPRPTPAEIKTLLEKITTGDSEESEHSEAEKEAIKDIT